MTIKFKILIPMVILTLVAAAAVLISNIIQFSNYVDFTIEESIDIASEVASDELEMKKVEAEAASLSIVDDPAISEAIANGDRDTLLSASKMALSKTNMDFCTITDASGIVIARPHAPDNYGDDVTAMSTVKSALSGKALSAVEPGASVLLSVCSGTPVFDENGDVLGVVVVGFRLDTNTLVDSIKALLGCEVTFFYGDERISTTIVKDDGTRAVGTKAAENVTQTVLAGNTYSGKAQILGKDAITRYSPIYGSDGKVLGMLFVGSYTTEETKTIWSFVQMGLIITLILMAISIPVILFITRHIVAPIKIMVEDAHALADGDTEINVQINSKDEMRDLAEAFTRIVDNTRNQVQIIEAIAGGDLTVSVIERSDKDVMNRALKSMLALNNDVFSQIVGSVNQVSSGARQMAESSQILAQGSTEQAAAVEQLSSSIAQIAQKTVENAQKADTAAKLAETIKGNADKGSRQMDDMMAAIKEINQASQDISKIIKVIDDIAFQTNILALNAAVEAARAGQHGKGFAVVAEEVRSLAVKSSEAAKDTGSLISNSMEKAGLGARIADETAVSLEEIVSGIKESSQLVGEIAKSSEEQSSGISEINKGIDQVAQVVQQNSATAEESAATSEELSGQSEMLKELIAQFKLKDF